MDPYASLDEFMSTQLYAWRDKELAEGDCSIKDVWQAICEVFEEMKAVDFFSPRNQAANDMPNNILFHWDLKPTNILVRPTTIPWKSSSTSIDTHDLEDRWVIDKIIDWDRVLSVPPVLTRKPPMWLWDFSDDIGRSSRTSIASDYDGDVDVFPPSRYDVESDRLSPNDAKIRQYFEEQYIAGLSEMYERYDKETYRDEAYRRGRWIQRLARYAIHGIWHNNDFTRFEHLDEEWATARSQCSAQAEVADKQVS